MGWIAIIGLPLGAWGIYLAYAFNKEAKPVYRVISDVVVTESRLNSKIKVYYDSIEVQNVRSVTITFWNAGNEFLGKMAFSQDKPISLKRTTPAQILEAQLVATTRPNLKFSQVYQRGKVPGTFDCINLQIQGDEGLEANDGATFSILYTGKTNGSWFVDARIKGVPKGVQQAVEQNRKYDFGDIMVFVTLLLSLSIPYGEVRRRGITPFSIFLSLILGSLFIYFLWDIIYIGYQTATLLSPPEVLVK
ncbi:hypothetical protein SD10_21525 [Spirosoma radiotolerans]|uniref:Uncharacterized protein n=2 Tax=Spirosoma radiotolerans TaxID=1379870 RepID=A0A0E3ZXR5_9BACT|nr:hypothetical protein SD10_21525 [Spirosoma radiotolerans]